MNASEFRATSRSVLSGMPATGQTRRLTLSGAPGAVGRCRDHTRSALEDWGWLPTADPDQQARADDVLLLVSELATNACQHAGGPDQLVLAATAHTLRIEVLDGSDEPPLPRVPHSPVRTGGHGLHTVALLASRWGHEPRVGAPGKAVWVEIDLPRG
ncbi:ATP-binding protein [Kitasatospora sp. NPDC052868]|uniref:ATP-binding protein n=1 Tax=Kitasatospora sp. NPDC052868 TaxID=3364060 RepID=UPI0037C90515